MTKQELTMKAAEQLAADCGCSPEDFFCEENHIAPPTLHPGRRRYDVKPRFFSIACMGHGLVITADPLIEDWAKTFFADKKGIFSFELKNLDKIEKELNKYGQSILPAGIHQYYIPGAAKSKEPTVPPDVTLRWYEKEEIPALYEDRRFTNALLYNDSLRSDVLAVTAIIDGQIAGMAGVSDDGPDMWQVGIDVLRGYRGKSLAKLLVSAITGETLRRGILPFYGAAAGNILSWKTAIACGYTPGWVEVWSNTIEE